MKQAAFNREFRLVENFSVKHLINHSSDIKHSLCSVHAVCESMYWLAAVALEETPYFSIAKEETVFWGKCRWVSSYIVSANGQSPHSLFELQYGNKCHLLLHGIPAPLLHQHGKRRVVRSKQMESHAQKHNQCWIWCAILHMAGFQCLATPPHLWCDLQDHFWQTHWCSQPVFPVISHQCSSSSVGSP